MNWLRAILKTFPVPLEGKRFFPIHTLMLILGLTVFAGCRPSETKSETTPQTNSNASLPWWMPTKAQPKLQTITLYMGPKEITAEVAATPEQVSTGMMYRTNIAENEGMFFVLRGTEQASFWMANCFIPLSVAYINPDGVIEEIHDLEPHNTNSVKSKSVNIRFALETDRGWFQKNGITPGTLIRTENGSLKETFLGER